MLVIDAGILFASAVMGSEKHDLLAPQASESRPDMWQAFIDSSPAN